MDLQPVFGNATLSPEYQAVVLELVVDHCATQTLNRICVVSKNWALICQSKLSYDARQRAPLTRKFMELTDQEDSYISKYKDLHLFSTSSDIPSDKITLRKQWVGKGVELGIVINGMLQLLLWGRPQLFESLAYGLQWCLEAFPSYLGNSVKAGGLGGVLGETSWEYHIWNSDAFKEWRLQQIANDFLKRIGEFFRVDQYLKLFVCPLSNKLLEDPIEASINGGSIEFCDRQTWQLQSERPFDLSYRIQLLVTLHQKRLLDQCIGDIESVTRTIKEGIQYLQEQMSTKISNLQKLAFEQLDTILKNAPPHVATLYKGQVKSILSGEKIAKEAIKPLRVIEVEIRDKD